MTIHVTLKPSNRKMELPSGSSAQDLARLLHQTAPGEALAVSINGTLRDLASPLKEGDEVSLLSFDEPEGKEVFWHSSAHILAQAVLRLWPEAKPTIGPPIEEGFYYDFANLSISDADFPKIEAEMEAIVKENFSSKREILKDKKAAKEAFGSNPYKIELIEGFPDEELTAYRQGEFYDLCRGPHLPSTGKVKALKVLKLSGAYWRGDSAREMLTRIYAITFPERKALKEYLDRIEEAKKRDHKILGPKLGLFSFCEEAPGMPFIHPHGMIIWNGLLHYWRLCHAQAGYVEIKTPMIMGQQIWETSGHWANYRQNMYTTAIDEREYVVKPMNCPGCMIYYKQGVHSYRELPLRIAEIGHVHRHEASGALSGLMRVRSFHQDDAHVFLESNQIEAEILSIVALVEQLFAPFNLDFTLELSTRPLKNTIGSDEMWEITTEALRQALEKLKRPYRINEGDGAFYGPKIDVHIRDALGRKWQCSTIQLDMSLPERFDLSYVTREGTKERPIMLHRALFGSIERFFGILIEHFAGRFPLWLSPRQVVLIPVADRHHAYAEEVARALKGRGFHVHVDASNESVSKKIRLAQLDQANYMVTLGDVEVEKRTLSIRTRENVQQGEISLEKFVSLLEHEKETRSLTSWLQK